MRKKAALLFTLFLAVTIFAPVLAQSAPEADSWVSKAPMHQARSDLGVVAVDGKIYAIGGSGGGPLNPVGTNEQYDPATDAWVYKASMPTPRAYFAIAAYQNNIYCFGGATGTELVDNRSASFTYIYSNAVEVYDTVTDNWTIKPHMPKGGGMYMTAQEVTGKIYVLNSPYIFVYDPDNDTWAENDNLPMANSMPVPKYSAVIDNKIVTTYAYDSWSAADPHFGNTVQQTVIYDPESNNLTQCKNYFPGAAVGEAAATTGVFAPQRVYVMGIIADTSPLASITLVYDPKNDNWTTAKAMPSIRSDFGLTTINDTIYAIGGILISYPQNQLPQAAITNTNEQYFPVEYGTSLHSPTANPSASSSSNTLQPTSPELPIIIAAIAMVLIISALALMRWSKKTSIKKKDA